MPNHYCTPQSFQLRLNLRHPATTNLPISGVIASGRQSINPASNVLDNNLNTRWANLGTGSSIRADLGSTKNICSVDIAWAYENKKISVMFLFL
jgi:hypothetical protein